MKHSHWGIAALICVVLIGDAGAHSWYTGKTDPVLHRKCCGNRDCHALNDSDVRPAPGGGVFVRQPEPYSRDDPPTGEWFIPKERVQASEDNRYHICAMLVPTNREGRLVTRWTCFFAPMNSTSIEQDQ